MPRIRFSNWQRVLGGLTGVVLLAFALTFHFFPRALNVAPSSETAARQTLPAWTPGQSAQAPARLRQSEINAGPPIALAPRAVLDRRTREKINAAMLAIASASTAPETPMTPEVAELLDHAGKALKQGNLADDDNSAATLYAQALRTKPDSHQAARGLAEVHVQLVTEIQQYLSGDELNNADDAIVALQQLPGTDVDAQRLQRHLADLRKVRPMLAHAAQLLQQGKLFEPVNNNALTTYRQVLDLDPDNTVAGQGLLRIQRKVLDKALAAVAQDDFDAANAALVQAARVVPRSQALHDTRQRVEDTRGQYAANLITQAHTALESGDLDLATTLKKKAQSFSHDIPGLKELNQDMGNARSYAGYHPGQVFSDSFLDIAGKGPMMVVIPTGSFLMGSDANDHEPDQAPQHQVQIARGFAMGRSEVTVAQFRKFVQASGYVPDSVKLGGSSVYDGRSGVMRTDRHATWEDDYAGNPASDNLPVVNISWNDAQAYVEWLSKRTGKRYQLPSEAQFAYALRAGTTTRYWWGDGVPTSKVENITGSGDKSPGGRRWTHAFKGYRDGYWGPAPVASFAPNPFGLYDMDGNVTEWVRDCWHGNYTRAPDDGSAWVNPGCDTRVIRGGSWGSGPDQLRATWRRGATADTRSGRVGFRVIQLL